MDDCDNKFSVQVGYSAPSECSYLPGSTEVLMVAVPPESITAQMHSGLSRQGFRRSGRFVYRPSCPQCSQCQSSRIVVGEFAMDRTMRKVWRRNCDLAFDVLPARYSEAHYRLFRKYESGRHTGGSMDNGDRTYYEQSMLESPFPTCLFEYRKMGPDGAPAEPVMVSVVDVLDDGLSAVYTFFDPDMASRSLGTFGILNQVYQAYRLGLPYVYLGFWIPDCRKMAYKIRFQPLEVFRDGGWVRTQIFRETK